MDVSISGKHFYLTVATNVMDDSESLEFRDADPREPGAELLAGLTWYDREVSPLLVYVPKEIDYTLLEGMIRFAIEWVDDNAPHIKLSLPRA